MNSTEFLSSLWDVFPAGKGLTAEQLAVYRAKLHRFSDEEQRGIYDWLLENCKFFPKIADIYEAAEQLGYLQRDLNYRPHEWEATECKLCGGSGLVGVFWKQEFSIGASGKTQTLTLVHLTPYHQSSSYLAANPDTVRTVYRCRCFAGDAKTLERGLPRWSVDHAAIIERGW